MQIVVRPDLASHQLVLYGHIDTDHAITVAQFLSGPVVHAWTLLIDLSYVTHLNATIVGVLLDAKASALKSGGAIHLCNPSEVVRQTFETLGVLDSLTDPSLLTRETPDRGPA